MKIKTKVRKSMKQYLKITSVKKIQKGRVVAICACQDKDTKQNAGNSNTNVRNDQINASHKYKILIGLLVCLFSLMANTSGLYFCQDIL